MRAVNAAITGLVAGVCGVVLIRAVFGPGVVLAGASVGLLAMIVAALLSWRALPPGRRAGAGPASRGSVDRDDGPPGGLVRPGVRQRG